MEACGDFQPDRQSGRGPGCRAARVRKYSAAYFISTGRIFLPMYSGVPPDPSARRRTR